MANDNRTDSQQGRRTATKTSRRTFLKAATAGTLATGFGLTGVGSAAASGGIPTPWLHRDGNLIKDPDGNEVILRGFNVADPKRLDVTAPARGKDAVQTIEYATSAEEGWYPRVIRLPVQPVDIGEHEPGHGPAPVAFSESELQSYLEDHLDPVVERCKERGVYCIVDYHRHRDVPWDDETLDEEVRMFWNVVAPRYSEESHVIYEVFNEPVRPGIWNDPAERDYQRDQWLAYVEHTQPWIDAIRSNADNLTLIGSPSWSQSPEGARVQEHEGEDLGYTYHIYAGHSVSQDEAWATNNDNGEGTSHIYEEVPLFVTEFGWQDGISAYPLIGTSDDFGTPFLEWLNSGPIHWTAWCFDPVWLPSMVKEGFDTPGFTDSVGNPYEEEVPALCDSLPCAWEPRTGQNMGGFIKQELYDTRNADVPSGGTGESDSTAPTVPSNLAATDSSQSSVTVGWEASSDSGGSGLAGYAVAVADRETTVAAGTTKATIAALSPDTSYEVSVAAVDGAGNRSPAATVTVQTDPGDGETDVEAIDGTTPQDVDGDGQYEDFNANGDVDFDDVVTYFEHMDEPVLTDHVGAYDYNGNEEVDFADVVSLFESV